MSQLLSVNTFYGIEIPGSLNHIAQVVEASRSILDLQDDWDGEGSSGYSEAVWKRATTFFLKNAVAFWQEYEECVPTPAISHGPEGSIDIYWNSSDLTLLINIPDDEKAPASYYGKKSSGTTISGTMSTSEKSFWLFQWLMD